jgi:periplasmic protein TonB
MSLPVPRPPRRPAPIRHARGAQPLPMRWALLAAVLLELAPALWSVLAHWQWHSPVKPPDHRVLRVRMEPIAQTQSIPAAVPPPPQVAEPPPRDETPPPTVESGRASRRPTPRPTPARPTPTPPPRQEAAPSPPPSPVPTAIPDAPSPAPDVPTASAPPPADGEDTGRPSTEPKPIYPRVALHDGVEGHVLVRFTVSETGTVTDVRVLEAEPPDVFERSVLRAASRYRFDPKGRSYTIDRDFVFRIRKQEP